MKATTTLCPPLVCSATFYVCTYAVGVGWRKLVRYLCRWCWVEKACEVLMPLVLGGQSL